MQRVSSVTNAWDSGGHGEAPDLALSDRWKTPIIPAGGSSGPISSCGKLPNGIQPIMHPKLC